MSDSRAVPASQEDLALLYQGLITGIARLQTERQHITNGESFRRRTRATLQEIEQVAVAAGHDGRDIRDTHFAVIALLDSVVMHSNDPARADWERKTLQEEIFGQTDAGVVFFEKLERFRTQQNSLRLAEILEVYLLCLLLGFQGRYSGTAMRAELDHITETIARRIDEIRGRSSRISPVAELPANPHSAIPRPQQPNRSTLIRNVGVGALCFTVLLLTVLHWNLSVAGDRLLGVLGSMAGAIR
jgi:type VI secretion system protein ImpK